MKTHHMMTDPSSGIVKFTSPWPYHETVERIEAALLAKKIKLFASIDQASEASAAGLTLRPTTLLIFGDPAKGAPLMEAYPSIAIDLPLKALIWEGSPSEVYVGLTSPDFLQQRHGLPSAPFAEVVRFFDALMKAGGRRRGGRRKIDRARKPATAFFQSARSGNPRISGVSPGPDAGASALLRRGVPKRGFRKPSPARFFGAFQDIEIWDFRPPSRYRRAWCRAGSSRSFQAGGSRRSKHHSSWLGSR